jgi:hypothetical protein
MDFDSVNGEITSYTGTRNFVIIPSTIDGRDVNIIGESAFADNNTFLESKSCMELITLRVLHSKIAVDSKVFIYPIA